MKTITVEFEVQDDAAPEELHEELCKVIHEAYTPAPDSVFTRVLDIKIVK